MDERTELSKAGTTVIHGGYKGLRQRLRRHVLPGNVAAGLLAVGGFIFVSSSHNAAAQSIILPIVCGSTAAVILTTVTQLSLDRRLHQTMIALFNGVAEPNAATLEQARRDILMIPWQTACVASASWAICTPIVEVMAVAMRSVRNEYSLSIAALGVVPAVFFANVLMAHVGCEPYRACLFTGVDVAHYDSSLLLTARRRFMVCLSFCGAVLVYCLLLIMGQLSNDPADVVATLPRVLAGFFLLGVPAVIAVASLALRIDPLEAVSVSDPDAKVSLSAGYEILDEVGRGGMGVVFKAKHRLLDRFVAIKMVDASLVGNTDAMLRFRHEARSASQLHHPGIVSVIDFGVLPGGRCYLVMEYIEGKSLAELLRTNGTLKPAEMLPMFISICDALAYAHERGFIHRDLKPSNIMLPNEPGSCPKLVDFGIAKQISTDPGYEIYSPLTRTGEVFGTPAYMSPEQCLGEKVDARADVYSIGCVMYETLSGRPPFIGDTPMAVCVAQMSSDVPPLPADADIPDELRLVVHAALSKERDKRYQTMRALADALRACVPDSKPARSALS